VARPYPCTGGRRPAAGGPPRVVGILSQATLDCGTSTDFEIRSGARSFVA